MATVLPAAFYCRDTISVARQLLGAVLVHSGDAGTTSGVIVETEAYLVNDPAAHSFVGKTVRNAALFGPSGCAYVYLIYGMHYCFNVVAGGMENGEAVLIRALEPVDGIGVMQERRGVRDGVKLCNGPAKLVQAMGIGREMNGIPVYRGDGVLRIEEGARYGDADIVTSRRIGVGKAVEELLRYYVKGNAYVSR